MTKVVGNLVNSLELNYLEENKETEWNLQFTYLMEKKILYLTVSLLILPVHALVLLWTGFLLVAIAFQI